MDALRFEPIYQERVWGGQALAAVFNREVPAGWAIGESWEIVDRPEAQSIVQGGPYSGCSLRSLVKNQCRDIMGPDWAAEQPFPILVKWLDCRERLSLQVHPPADKARALGGEPKTENWFIARAEPGASLLVGLRRGVTPAEFERALADGTLERYINQFLIAAGDSILVRSGTVHAIDAGNLILEIQQNSDTTYRVYDWGRLGLDGKPRQLHRREAMASILWGEPEPSPVHAAATPAVLADCAEFRLRRVPLASGGTVKFSAGQQPRLLHVISGCIRNCATGEAAGHGVNLLLPYADAFAFAALENSLLLVTENFT